MNKFGGFWYEELIFYLFYSLNDTVLDDIGSSVLKFVKVSY